ncbi:MAG: glycosyltransferase [Chitinophagales bacterium]
MVSVSYGVILLFLIIEVINLAVTFFRRKEITHEHLEPFPFVSVIIPGRNEALRIDDCLESITRQSYPNDRYEVILVDDNSTDNTFFHNGKLSFKVQQFDHFKKRESFPKDDPKKAMPVLRVRK